MSVETKERYIWFWVAIKLDAMVIDVEFIQVILLFNSTDQRVYRNRKMFLEVNCIQWSS